MTLTRSGQVVLDADWWRRSTIKWNASPEHIRRQLAGLGVLGFRVVDGDVTVHIHWDGDGFATIVNGDIHSATLEADRDTWQSFLRGEFSAAAGVVTGRISFTGQLFSIIRYTSAFNVLRDVAAASH